MDWIEALAEEKYQHQDHGQPPIPPPPPSTPHAPQLVSGKGALGIQSTNFWKLDTNLDTWAQKSFLFYFEPPAAFI